MRQACFYEKLNLKFIVFLLMMVGLSGCKPEPEEALTRTDLVMGTVLRQNLYYSKGQQEQARQTLEEVYDYFVYLEEIFSANPAYPESDVNKISRSGGQEAVNIHEETAEVIEKGIWYGEDTGGIFDITIRPVVELWGFDGNGSYQVPNRQDIADLLELVDYKTILLEGTTAYLQNEGQKLDLGGIAKGYGADKAVEIYRKNGFSSASVNVGGNIKLLGAKPNDSPFRIGIRDPLGDEGLYFAILTVKDQTIVTSGVYERSFTADDILYHHMIDPNTGYPADNGLLSVTIVTEVSMDADAMATSVFIMGLADGLQYIENKPGFEAVFVLDDFSVIATEGLKGRLELVDTDYKLEYSENAIR